MIAGAGGDERPKEKSSSGLLDPEAAAPPVVDTLESKENVVFVAKADFWGNSGGLDDGAMLNPKSLSSS